MMEINPDPAYLSGQRARDHNEILFFNAGEIRLAVCRLALSCGERRQIEKSAVARLAETMLAPGTMIDHQPDGRPFATRHSFSREISSLRDSENAPSLMPEISISHSRRYAALAVAPTGNRIGIDIEDADRLPQLSRLAARVMNESELKAYSAVPEGLLMAWTLKESAFKASFLHPVDFLHEIFLPAESQGKYAEESGLCPIINVRKKSALESVKIVYSGFVLPGLILSVVKLAD